MKRMVEQNTGEGVRVPLFSLQAPAASGWARLVAPLTKRGRVRRRLRKASDGKDSSRTWRILKRDFLLLKRKDKQRDLAVSVAEALLWYCISRRDISGLNAEWFAILPEADERTQKLRWDMSVLAADSGDYDLFKRFAFDFLRAGTLYKWSRLCFLIAHAYACGERTDCVSMLKSSFKKPTQKSQRIARDAAMSLCMLSANAPSLEWLLRKAKPIRPEILDFSPEMQADAYLVQARIADWRDDRLDMEAKITAAGKIKSNSSLVAYWRQRFEFRNVEHSVRFKIEPSDDNPAWRRLEKMAEAVADPTLKNATIVQKILTQQHKDIELPEQRLILRVLRPILTATFGQSVADIKRIDFLCTELDGVSDAPIEWSQHTHALAALLNGHLDEACDIVDSSRLPSNQASRELQKTINLLRGRCDSPTLIDPMAFSGITSQVVERVPCLAELKEMIDLAPQLASGGIKAFPSVLEQPLPPSAPSWIRWLQMRLAFLAEPNTFLSRANSLDVCDVMVAWEFDRIVRNVLPLGANANTQVIQARKTLEKCDFLDYSKSCKGQLGELVSLEVDIDTEFRAVAAECALQDLGAGATQRMEATESRRKRLEGLKKRVLRSQITASFWVPVLEYWQAVAGLSVLDTEDSPDFSSESWMWPRAVGQLALFKIARGDLVAAEQWLDQAMADHAGVVYAQALLAARRGDSGRSMELIDELIEAATNCPTYTQAAKRLKGALLERGGDSGAALDIYLALLEQNTEDAVARTRSLRILLQRSYGSKVDGDGSTLLKLADKRIPDIATFRRLQKIVSLILSGSDVSVDGEPNGLCLLKGRQLLAKGDLDAAALTIEQTEAIASKHILQAAGLLRALCGEVFGDAQFADYQRQVEGCKRSFEALSDDTLRTQIERWQGYLQLALDVLRAVSDPNNQQREFLSALQSDRWTKAQRSLAGLLSAPEDAVQDDYLALLPELDALPVDGADVWLAFARQWLKDSNFTELLESELPDCVAELDDPRIRWIIALGYTKASVEAYRKQNGRQAINWANRARTTLEELVNVETQVAEPVMAHGGELDGTG
jgi:hypothetical protein